SCPAHAQLAGHSDLYRPQLLVDDVELLICHWPSERHRGRLEALKIIAVGNERRATHGFGGAIVVHYGAVAVRADLPQQVESKFLTANDYILPGQDRSAFRPVQ